MLVGLCSTFHHVTIRHRRPPRFQHERNNFVCKEVAVVYCTDVGAASVRSYVLGQPFPYALQSEKHRRQTQWLRRHLGLRWEEDGIPYVFYPSIMRKLLADIDIVFVKGLEKQEWLRDFVSPTCQFVDLHEWGCPALQSFTCSRSGRASVQHVKALFTWLCNHRVTKTTRSV